MIVPNAPARYEHKVRHGCMLRGVKDMSSECSTVARNRVRGHHEQALYAFEAACQRL
jgi:hypothetical protein